MQARKAFPYGALIALTMLGRPVLGAEAAPAERRLPVSMDRIDEMKALPMHSILFEADVFAQANPSLTRDELVGVLERSGLVVLDGLVHVEVVGPEESDAAGVVTLDRFGGRIDQTFANRADGWLPPDRLVDAARALPAGFQLEKASQPGLDAVAGEGPGAAVTNSAGYRDAGANGSQVRIAVIDTGFNGLTAARANGDAPATANTTFINLTPMGFETGTTHGTGCVEAIFDHAPGATWRLYRVDTVTDLGNVVTDCIANSVDIISHSLSWYNMGWADDSGAACAAANQASNAGIVFVTSAGNRALDHWEGTYTPGQGSTEWHDWVTGDENMAVVVAADTTASFQMQWNTAGGTFDYDLYLFDAAGTTMLASSQNPGNSFESLTWVNTSTSTATVTLKVNRVSGGATAFEVFGDNLSVSWEYDVPAGSTTSPSNSTGVNVLSVGAVTWGQFAAADSVAPIAAYSSQGPSNGGMLQPDVIGPTDTTGFTYPAGFRGTSCATPNVVGALSAFWSDQVLFSGAAIAWLARGQAEHVGSDWGAAGPDNVYGYGPLRLVSYAAGTRWLARSWGNTTNQTSGPYYTVAAAQSSAPSGGRIVIFPGGIYPELVNLTKALKLETVDAVARLGP